MGSLRTRVRAPTAAAGTITAVPIHSLLWRDFLLRFLFITVDLVFWFATRPPRGLTQLKSEPSCDRLVIFNTVKKIICNKKRP